MSLEINKTVAPTVALCGNPNTGKSTIFNRLTGARQKVANFPGVTVEKKEGRFASGDQSYVLVDLPGMHSLDPLSADEAIASSYILGSLRQVPPPNCVAVVLDGTTLEKGLFLVSQLRDLQVPIILIINMLDVLQKSGKKIDLEMLSQKLGVPVMGMVATKDIQATLLSTLIQKVLSAEKFVTPNKGSTLMVRSQDGGKETQAWTQDVQARYRWARQIASEVISKSHVVKRSPQDVTDAIDRVVLHPVLGPVFFLITMGVLFQSVFTWAAPLMDLINLSVEKFSQGVSGLLPDGLLRSFLGDGVITGVGNVIVFVPQIMILFGLITILEDSGYLARASFLLDRLLVKTGLGGKSFIPLLSSFACAVPGIMASRHIENRFERLITIMVAPLMTCSARLPVYTLLVGAFIPSIMVAGIFQLQGLVFLGLYVLGVLGAAVAAFVMKKIWMRRNISFFVAELPLYRMPRWKNVWSVMFQRGKLFVLKVGKVILICTVILWILAAFPRQEALEQEMQAVGRTEGEIRSTLLAGSYIGRLGHLIEPVIQPLGFDWKIGVGILSSFAAREVMVSTMATLYSMGEADEQSLSLKQALREDRTADGRPVFTLATALSLLVFFVFAMQCMSTLAIARKETGSWLVPSLMFVYMTLMAYGASFLTYRFFT